MSIHGDNKNSCHDLKTLINEEDHILAYCTECKKRFYVKPKDRKGYAKLFKKDTLQPGGNNLYYKYYGKLNVL
jgi:hypothetical protein